MPQEKGWFLHGGDVQELMARVERRVGQLTREAAEFKGPEPEAARGDEGRDAPGPAAPEA